MSTLSRRTSLHSHLAESIDHGKASHDGVDLRFPNSSPASDCVSASCGSSSSRMREQYHSNYEMEISFHSANPDQRMKNLSSRMIPAFVESFAGVAVFPADALLWKLLLLTWKKQLSWSCVLAFEIRLYPHSVFHGRLRCGFPLPRLLQRPSHESERGRPHSLQLVSDVQMLTTAPLTEQSAIVPVDSATLFRAASAKQHHKLTHRCSRWSMRRHSIHVISM